MSDLISYFLSPASFVHAATFCYVCGLLTRRELMLRLFLLAGTVFYILYYYHVSTYPLWEAIFSSMLIGSANLPVIYRIFRERSTIGMSEQMLSLYQHFPNFNPGQFRKIMSKGEITVQDKDTDLLQEGAEPGKLFLTISDGFVVKRDSQQADIGPGNFLGEISFLLDGKATANVTAKAGASYVSWDVGQLRYMMANSSTMATAISVLLNKDIARKLAVSFPSRAMPFPDNVT